MTNETALIQSLIQSLRSEAAAAGDHAQVALCDKAIACDRRAIAECLFNIALNADSDTVFELVSESTNEIVRRATPGEVAEFYETETGHIDVGGRAYYVEVV